MKAAEGEKWDPRTKLSGDEKGTKPMKEGWTGGDEVREMSFESQPTLHPLGHGHTFPISNESLHKVVSF